MSRSKWPGNMSRGDQSSSKMGASWRQHVARFEKWNIMETLHPGSENYSCTFAAHGVGFHELVSS